MSKGIEQRVEAILRDQTHGAAFLAREALVTMKLAAVASGAEEVDSFLREVAGLGDRLITLRPSMSAAIANGVVRAFDAIWREARSGRDVRGLKEVACEAADRLLEVAEENARKAVGHVCSGIPEGATVLTHSYSETCLGALLACAGKGVRVFATESRPLCEGRKMAASLREGGVEVILLTDAEAGHFVREAQMVLVGADTVLADGSVINKMGTYLIALAARDSGVPFWVGCDSWKFRIEDGVPGLEEKSPEEVADRATGIRARNIYFDVTPVALVTSLVTEDGGVPAGKVRLSTEKWRKVLRAMRELARR